MSLDSEARDFYETMKRPLLLQLPIGSYVKYNGRDDSLRWATLHIDHFKGNGIIVKAFRQSRWISLKNITTDEIEAHLAVTYKLLTGRDLRIDLLPF
jgi:hypothetical protein